MHPAASEVPDLQELADRYRQGGRLGLVAEYRDIVSAATVDRWLRMARDQGYLEPSPRTGRPPKKPAKTTGSNRSRTTAR